VSKTEYLFLLLSFFSLGQTADKLSGHKLSISFGSMICRNMSLHCVTFLLVRNGS